MSDAARAASSGDGASRPRSDKMLRARRVMCHSGARDDDAMN